MKSLLAKLDVEGFVFDIDGTLPATLPALPNMALKAPNDHTLTLEMPRSQDLNGVFAALSAAGIRVRSMRTESNRLEELFVRLTGENKVARAAAGVKLMDAIDATARVPMTPDRRAAPTSPPCAPSRGARWCASCASGARPWCRRRSP
jgi:ABC-2 type transport system ATP-binding protein